MYPADGRKFFDVYAWPYGVRTDIKKDLGEFPFPGFWGPVAGKDSPQGRADAASRWIAASARWIEERHSPDLSLVYLPHLDYNLQRLGPMAVSGSGLNPAIGRDLREIDAIFGELRAFYAARGVRVAVVSEYGITPVTRAVHLNRVFRERGWLVVKEELGLELLDAGASRAFAVADHQVAHLYVRDPDLIREVRKVVEAQPGVAEVLDADGKRARGIDHARSGDLIAVAAEDAWFTYYYWLDDARAPDFARTVDIHRKPGYDPVELFADPALSPLALKARIGWRLLQKKLGFRMLMDVIPLDAGLVKGSHGCRPRDRADWPMLMLEGGKGGERAGGRGDAVVKGGALPAVGVRDVLLGWMDGA
jgi:predicted AlkP superfamily pyrophosphatase or phosphodiesterase